MHSVKSKYKNPDQYIKRLKEDLSFERGTVLLLRQDMHRERGTHWFTWFKDAENTVVLDGSYTIKARLHQQVIITGYISGYRRTPECKETVDIALTSTKLIDSK